MHVGLQTMQTLIDKVHGNKTSVQVGLIEACAGQGARVVDATDPRVDLNGGLCRGIERTFRSTALRTQTADRAELSHPSALMCLAAENREKASISFKSSVAKTM